MRSIRCNTDTVAGAPAEFTTRAWTKEEALIELVRGPVAGSRSGDGDTARTTTQHRAERHRLGARGARRRRLRHARPVHAGHKRNRVVRTPAAGTHPPLHHRTPARRNRTTAGRGFSALPVPLAGALVRAAPGRPAGAGSRCRTAGRLRSRGCRLGADILPARLQHYDPEWLDSLCLSGRLLWARLTPPKPVAGKDKVSAPVRTTPIALVTRPHSAPWQNW